MSNPKVRARIARARVLVAYQTSLAVAGLFCVYLESIRREVAPKVDQEYSETKKAHLAVSLSR